MNQTMILFENYIPGNIVGKSTMIGDTVLVIKQRWVRAGAERTWEWLNTVDEDRGEPSCIFLKNRKINLDIFLGY